MRRLLAAAVLATVLCALAAPAPAGAARPLEVAVQDDLVFLYGQYYDRDRAFEQIRNLGVTRLRVSLGWAGSYRSATDARSSRAPSSPQYDFSRHDDLIDAAAANGIRVQLMVIPPAPAFATGDRKIGEERPSAKRFAAFVRDVATHFKGRVDRYSMWNEPTHVGWLTPQSQAARLYRDLYRRGYAAVKRVDPTAQVLLGELVPYKNGSRSQAPLRFLRDLTCTRPASAAPARGAPRLRKAGSCPAIRTDGVAHHPYDYVGPPERRYPGVDNVTIGTLDRLTGTLKELSRLGVLRTPTGRTAPIFLTEFGYFASGRYRHPDARRGSYLRRAYQIALRTPSVRQIAQYILVKPPRNVPGSYFDMSLIAMDGDPFPPFNALSAWTRKAGGRGDVRLPGAPIQLPPRPADGWG